MRRTCLSLGLGLLAPADGTAAVRGGGGGDGFGDDGVGGQDDARLRAHLDHGGGGVVGFVVAGGGHRYSGRSHNSQSIWQLYHAERELTHITGRYEPAYFGYGVRWGVRVRW